MGIFYDKAAQAEAAALVSDWTLADMEYMREQVPKIVLLCVPDSALFPYLFRACGATCCILSNLMCACLKQPISDTLHMPADWFQVHKSDWWQYM